MSLKVKVLFALFEGVRRRDVEVIAQIVPVGVTPEEHVKRELSRYTTEWSVSFLTAEEFADQLNDEDYPTDEWVTPLYLCEVTND